MSQPASMRGADFTPPNIKQSPRFQAAASSLSLNKPLFLSPPPAGRKITAGFSYIQRIGKSSAIDVWFPTMLRHELDKMLAEGRKLGPDNFPAEWAAVRQFELLQEAGNYKIYDMRADYLTRSLMEMTRSMRGGGYRVTVATIGSYESPLVRDDLEILDRRLQKRISSLIHMLYLDEQSESINKSMDAALAKNAWNYPTALPHIGVTLGARDLFKPVGGSARRSKDTMCVPCAPHQVSFAAKGWICDLGVSDNGGQVFAPVPAQPKSGQYCVQNGVYLFAAEDSGREITVSYMHNVGGQRQARDLNAGERKHKLAQQFFDIVDLLPNKHIVHDTAVGLQLPESINENEWIYLTAGDEQMGCFQRLLSDLFTPFDRMSLSGLDGRADAKAEVKSTMGHLRSYGDRLTPESDQFYRNLAQFALN